MHIHGLDTEQALASLKTTAAGLTADEAGRWRSARSALGLGVLAYYSGIGYA